MVLRNMLYKWDQFSISVLIVPIEAAKPSFLYLSNFMFELYVI